MLLARKPIMSNSADFQFNKRLYYHLAQSSFAEITPLVRRPESLESSLSIVDKITLTLFLSLLIITPYVKIGIVHISTLASHGSLINSWAVTQSSGCRHKHRRKNHTTSCAPPSSVMGRANSRISFSNGHVGSSWTVKWVNDP
jgi:hypothetical protein